MCAPTVLRDQQRVGGCVRDLREPRKQRLCPGFRNVLVTATPAAHRRLPLDRHHGFIWDTNCREGHLQRAITTTEGKGRYNAHLLAWTSEHACVDLFQDGDRVAAWQVAERLENIRVGLWHPYYADDIPLVADHGDTAAHARIQTEIQVHSQNILS